MTTTTHPADRIIRAGWPDAHRPTVFVLAEMRASDQALAANVAPAGRSELVLVEADVVRYIRRQPSGSRHAWSYEPETEGAWDREEARYLVPSYGDVHRVTVRRYDEA